MNRKRSAIVDAALEAFLESGYAETSMDRIAAAADVSIKTVYRHFKNKDDLFSAVMQAACNPSVSYEEKTLSSDPPWFLKPARAALTWAGAEYLKHILSKQQLALYRVVTRDANRFPELGRGYHQQVVESRIATFTRFLQLRAPIEKWKIKNPPETALVFDALLRAGLFEDALHGVHEPSEREIAAHARSAASTMLILLQSSCL